MESGDRVECQNCSCFIDEDTISNMAKILGYSGECTEAGTFFVVENINEQPAWCPLIKVSKNVENLPAL